MVFLERLGVAIEGSNAQEAVRRIEQAEVAGIHSVWMTSGAAGGADVLTVYSNAASRTRLVKLGTSVVQAYTRHPLVLAQQALAVASFAPGRVRLGVGSSHRHIMEKVYGIKMGAKVLEYMREYITVLRAALWEGKVDEFSGKHFRIKGYAGLIGLNAQKSAGGVNVPIYLAALNPLAFRLAGEVADGAITWMCPPSYIKTKALAAIEEGSAVAGKSRIPIIAHVPVVLSTSWQDVKRVATVRFMPYVRSEFYRKMFLNAGVDPDDIDSVIRAVLVWGNEEDIKEGLGNVLGDGIEELIVQLLPTSDADAELRLLLSMLAKL